MSSFKKTRKTRALRDFPQIRKKLRIECFSFSNGKLATFHSVLISTFITRFVSHTTQYAVSRVNKIMIYIQSYFNIGRVYVTEQEIAFFNFNEMHNVIALRWRILIYARIADIPHHFIIYEDEK